MKKKKKLVLITLLIFFMAIIIFLTSHPKNNPLLPTDGNAVSWHGKQDLKQKTTQENKIAIPGFSSLVFNAGTLEQKVNFFNPEQNTCLFKMNLYVNDTLFWESGYVAPGNGYYDIELLDTLTAGEYNGSLLLQCFKEDGSKLNSANVEFNLTVEDNAK